jgi:hypothetical protein
MSSTSPSDLAITFRSIPRRLREAQGDTAAAATQSHNAVISGHLASAGRLMHTTADPAQIADAIDALPADEWDEDTLDQLRSMALELGGELRKIAALRRDRDD